MNPDAPTDASNAAVGLPAAGMKAKQIVFWQLLSGLAQGLFGLLQFPLFLLRRHAITSHIAKIIKAQSESSLKDEIE